MKTAPTPLPKTLAKVFSRRFAPLGNFISRAVPTLKLDLFQAGMDVNPAEYAALGLVSAVVYGVLFFVVLFLLNDMLKLGFGFLLPTLFGLAFFAFMLFSFLMYPKILARKRMRALEANLVPALRHLLIQIKSGVPLFNAMNAISDGYGETSQEFKKIVSSINTGEKEEEAISEATKRNPSFNFRRALWQISNALKAGSDLGNALQAIVDDLTAEQITMIRRYGQQLNPWTMIYMIAAVIIPSLGITFLVLITSFSGAQIPKIIFPLILGALLGFQLFFMNFVKSKRPPIA